MKLLLRLLACLPLAANHALGAIVGRMVFLLSPKYRHCLLENASRSGVVPAPGVRRFARRNTEENGKGLIELAWALVRPDQVVAARSDSGSATCLADYVNRVLQPAR